MSPELQNLISLIAKAAKAWHAIEPSIKDADILINGDPHWIDQLTQPAIDAVPSLLAVNLQVAEVTAVLYILKTMNAVPEANNIAAWVKLSNLS